MGNTLQVNTSELHVAQVVHHGEKLILPEGMGVDDAIDLLKRRQKYLEEPVKIVEVLKVFPYDGAYALARAVEAVFGWVPAEATMSFFGPQPPELRTIEIGPNRRAEIPWGKMSMPTTDGGVIHTSVFRANADSPLHFQIIMVAKRKDEATARRLIQATRDFLREGSIYKGQAIRIRFNDEGGDPYQIPEVEFIDTRRVDTSLAMYNEDLQDSIETNLFAPIIRASDCIANDIPVKRGVLLGGTYGTGKTLAARVAAAHAVDNGVTYVYVPRADELRQALQFARQYQSPAAVVFCEDVDRVTAGERSVSMDDILNTIDGVDTKDSHIIVVLTTNDLESINPAMLRPGRLDAVIEVLPPNGMTAARLLRAYCGDSLPKDADISEAGKLLAGQIPAVIAEVAKRAKLAELRRTPRGTMVRGLSAESLIEAARTMQGQINLLARRTQEGITKLPTLDSALNALVETAVGSAFNGRGKKIDEIHERTVG